MCILICVVLFLLCCGICVRTLLSARGTFVRLRPLPGRWRMYRVHYADEKVYFRGITLTPTLTLARDTISICAEENEPSDSRKYMRIFSHGQVFEVAVTYEQRMALTYWLESAPLRLSY